MILRLGASLLLRLFVFEMKLVRRKFLRTMLSNQHRRIRLIKCKPFHPKLSNCKVTLSSTVEVSLIQVNIYINIKN